MKISKKGNNKPKNAVGQKFAGDINTVRFAMHNSIATIQVRYTNILLNIFRTLKLPYNVDIIVKNEPTQ